MAAWQHSKVLSDIQMEVMTDRESYGFRQPISLTVKLTNTGADRFELSGHHIRRSAYILIMEREGTGTYAMSLKFLFGQVSQLIINPGESISTGTSLRYDELSDKAVTDHYEFPASTRTLQVFLPLASEIPSAYENMLGASADGVAVVDSWTSDPDLRFPRFIYWFVKLLRMIFAARP